jgi:hypothetical protein
MENRESENSTVDLEEFRKIQSQILIEFKDNNSLGQTLYNVTLKIYILETKIIIKKNK